MKLFLGYMFAGGVYLASATFGLLQESQPILAQTQNEKQIEQLQRQAEQQKQQNDRLGEAMTFSSIGMLYQNMGKNQEALKYYHQALPLHREAGNRLGEAITLSNIAFSLRNTNRQKEAIANLEQSAIITLEIRQELLEENRHKFLQQESGKAVALIDILIRQNQIEKAFEWRNRFTTFDLADYTRLINAKISNPQARKAIDEWQYINQQVEYLWQQLQDTALLRYLRYINCSLALKLSDLNWLLYLISIESAVNSQKKNLDRCGNWKPKPINKLKKLLLAFLKLLNCLKLQLQT